MTDSVIDKVRKLLAVAAPDSGATDGERAAAVDAAQRLMTRYRLDEAAVRAAGDGPSMPTDVVAVDLGDFVPRDYWALDLLTAIGQVVTVDAVFVQTGARRAVTLIGRDASVAYVRLLYGWLRPQIEADAVVIVEAERGYRELMGRAPTADDLDRYREGFYAGAIGRVHERLEAAQAREAGAYGTDLVVSDRAALERYYGDDAPQRVDTVRPMDAEAAISGYRAGDRVDLDPANKVAGARRPELAG